MYFTGEGASARTESEIHAAQAFVKTAGIQSANQANRPYEDSLIQGPPRVHCQLNYFSFRWLIPSQRSTQPGLNAGIVCSIDHAVSLQALDPDA